MNREEFLKNLESTETALCGENYIVLYHNEDVLEILKVGDQLIVNENGSPVQLENVPLYVNGKLTFKTRRATLIEYIKKYETDYQKVLTTIDNWKTGNTYESTNKCVIS